MKKRLLTFAFATALSLGYCVAGNSLKVSYLDGTDRTEALATVGKLTFTSETITLYSKDNQVLATSPISNVRKITFEEGISTSVQNAEKAQIQVYPNPTQDQLIISGLEKGKTVRVYSTSGVLLKSVTSGEGQLQVPVSELKAGTYLLQVETNVLKFVKE